MRRKRRKRASVLGFSEQKFLELLSAHLGHPAVGELGRDTPLDLSSQEAASKSLLLREIFSKFDDGKPSPAKEETTWKRFQEAEDACRRTNKLFPALADNDPFWICVRRRIWDTLGRFNWDKAAKLFRFGPGATTRLTKQESYGCYKYSGIPESTIGNAVLARCAIAYLPLWKQSVQSSAEASGIDDLVSIVPGNSVIAVPKNYKTHRTIAKEPDMNIYIQLGIGTWLKRILYSVGVDLFDQSKNQRAALKGSITGELATIDLSMASDTLSYEVVGWLLPNDWWWALEQCRSPVGVLPSGNKVKYQKFSSMGNGYTFELESLIFWAISQQVCCSNVNETDLSVSVYGDDIIVPSVHARTLLERLSQAGFTANEKKSFWEGPFRESCGLQCYLGADITPFYVRKPVTELDRLFLLHNNLKRWGERTSIDVSDILMQIRRFAPASWRTPRLPDGFGDGAFIGSVDELRLDSHPYGWDGWQARVLLRTSTELTNELPPGQLVVSLLASQARKTLLSKSCWRRVRNRSCPTIALDPETGVAVISDHVRNFFPDDVISGLPAREGRYEVRNIFIPRHPTTA